MYEEYSLKLGLKTISDKAVTILCHGVISGMTGNANFPDAGALLTELITAFEEFNNSIPGKAERNEINAAIKDAKKDVVKKKLRKLGFYVQMIAEDDIEKLKSSGYLVAKKKGTTSSSELPMPVILSLETNGTPRELTVKCKPSKAARLYDIRTSTDQINWTTKTDTKSKVAVNDVPAEVVVFVQARMRNAHHTTPWSPISQTRIFDSVVAISMSN